MALGELAALDLQPRNVAKITPPRRRADILSRSRLLDFVTEHLDRKLILVCAPAGYGKTALLADFARHTRLPVCWYTLSPSDADPRIFLEYLVASIRRHFANFGDRTLSYVRSAGAKDLDAIVGLLLGEIQGLTEQPVIVVLDDVHTVDENPAIQGLLNRLVSDLPPNWCCVVVSRSVPRLRISRLVANREAAGLGDADLRFTQAEIQQLFTRHYKLVVPEAMLEEIARESEGWIAGIILTSHALWQGLFKGWIQSRRTNGPVFDYLAAEVFDNQSAELQNFLLATSTLDRLTPVHCAELSGTGDAAKILRGLDKEGLFIAALDGQEEAYRYHSLFQEFLQTRLRQVDPERYRALHRRAGELTEDEEGVALDHYLKAGETARAGALVERVAEKAIGQGRVHSVLQWCGLLPEDVFVERPRLQIARYQAAFDTGDLDLAWQTLEHAYARSQELGDQRALATTLIWRSTMLRVRGKLTEAIADCRAGVAIAEEIVAADLLAYGHRQLGISLTAQGTLDEAVEVLKRSLTGYIDLGDHYNQGVVCHTLGIIWRRKADTGTARAILDEAVHQWQLIGNRGMLAGTLVVLGNLHYDQGELDAAEQVLGEARAAASESGYLRLHGYATESLGDVTRDRGDSANAVSHYEQSLSVAEQVGDRYLQVTTLEGLARCYRYANNAGLARATVLRARHLASEREVPLEQGLCADTYGVLCLDNGEFEAALSTLEQACQLLKAASVRDRGRAQLHYAQALLQSGKRAEAVALAAEALEGLTAGPAEPLLTAESAQLATLLHAVGTRGPRWLAEVLERLGPSPIDRLPGREVVPSPASQSRIECLTLGRADVLLDGRLLEATDWPTQKARELWFYLLTVGPTTRDQIGEAIWPDVDIDPSVFHTTVHRLRRALFPECVERHGSLWRVNASLAVCMEDRIFEDEAMRVRQLNQNEASEENLATLLRATSLYRGRYLDGLDADWISPTRRRLEGLYLRLLRDGIEGLRSVKRHADAIAQAEVFLQITPDDEGIHEAILRSYVSLGNRAAAVRHYQRYAKQLRDELAAEPSRRLRFLYEQLTKEN
ncbi:MAG TPA: tetratricopeptide repeat protein [Chloroflexota bacterium]|nr:tetratricopeptide repeat protein [Chloroflexota bacterium]